MKHLRLTSGLALIALLVTAMVAWAYWTTSGEFVFVAILAGTGSVFAPFLGAAIFETIRSFAYEYSPNTWQMALGITMLLVIMFLPGGLWSLFGKWRKAAA